MPRTGSGEAGAEAGDVGSKNGGDGGGVLPWLVEGPADADSVFVGKTYEMVAGLRDGTPRRHPQLQTVRGLPALALQTVLRSPDPSSAGRLPSPSLSEFPESSRTPRFHALASSIRRPRRLLHPPHYEFRIGGLEAWGAVGDSRFSVHLVGKAVKVLHLTWTKSQNLHGISLAANSKFQAGVQAFSWCTDDWLHSMDNCSEQD